MLPRQGDVLVRTGQQVKPRDIVARASLPQPYLIVNVAKELNVSRDRSRGCMLRNPGDRVRPGDVLAWHKGGFRQVREVTSPVDGKVIAADGGRVIIELEPEPFELRAVLSGTVAEVAPGYGVTIETPGALIQGVWGSGKEGYGVLATGVKERSAVLDARQVQAAHRGTILVCGAVLDEEVLARAQELQVRGLIVGGIPAELQERVCEQLVPVVATEGVGRAPISSAIFDLLQQNQGRQATILAVLPDRWKPSRPEIIIPLPASQPADSAPSPRKALSANLAVRVRRSPYWGAVGRVKEISNEPRAVESGVKFRGAEVILEDGTLAFVPNVNLELVT